MTLYWQCVHFVWPLHAGRAGWMIAAVCRRLSQTTIASSLNHTAAVTAGDCFARSAQQKFYKRGRMP